MVLLKMLMEIALPKMGELLAMMMTTISPSGREVPPAESLHRRASRGPPSLWGPLQAPDTHLLLYGMF